MHPLMHTQSIGSLPPPSLIPPLPIISSASPAITEQSLATTLSDLLPIRDIGTWTQCFMVNMAVLPKAEPECTTEWANHLYAHYNHSCTRLRAPRVGVEATRNKKWFQADLALFKQMFMGRTKRFTPNPSRHTPDHDTFTGSFSSARKRQNVLHEWLWWKPMWTHFECLWVSMPPGHGLDESRGPAPTLVLLEGWQCYIEWEKM